MVFLPNGWMYILECSDGSFYTGSTNNLADRLMTHFSGNDANHTKKRCPLKLVYFEKYEQVYDAFYREKQNQKWRREKKLALINQEHWKLPGWLWLKKMRLGVPQVPGIQFYGLLGLLRVRAELIWVASNEFFFNDH